MKKILFAGFFGVALMFTDNLQAQIETKQLAFTRSIPAKANISTSIQGSQTVDYVFHSAAGQLLTVDMKHSSGSPYFNILPPGSQGEAIYNSSMDGNTYSGTLSAEGTYAIRTYQMRSAARRNEKAAFTLHITLGPAPKSATEDALVPGTSFNATGQVPGALGYGQRGGIMADFGVIRHKDRSATVYIKDQGVNRVLRFENGEWTCTSPDCRILYSRESDEWKITINDRVHYFIPDAVLFGG